MMSDVDLPAAHTRNQEASAIDVIVHLARLRDGRRVVFDTCAWIEREPPPDVSPLRIIMVFSCAPRPSMSNSGCGLMGTDMTTIAWRWRRFEITSSGSVVVYLSPSSLTRGAHYRLDCEFETNDAFLGDTSDWSYFRVTK